MENTQLKSERLNVYGIYGKSGSSYGYQVGKKEKEALEKALEELRDKDVMKTHAFFDSDFSAVEIKVSGFDIFAKPSE